MPAAVFNLTGDNIIEAGGFWALTLRFPGDVRRAQFKGQIRKKHGGELLANFSFSALSYDETADKTSILMALSSRQTEPLPIPATGESWVYDVYLFPASQPEPKRILQGRVSVSPGVTDV